MKSKSNIIKLFFLLSVVKMDCTMVAPNPALNNSLGTAKVKPVKNPINYNHEIIYKKLKADIENYLKQIGNFSPNLSGKEKTQVVNNTIKEFVSKYLNEKISILKEIINSITLDDQKDKANDLLKELKSIFASVELNKTNEINLLLVALQLLNKGIITFDELNSTQQYKKIADKINNDMSLKFFLENLQVKDEPGKDTNFKKEVSSILTELQKNYTVKISIKKDTKITEEDQKKICLSLKKFTSSNEQKTYKVLCDENILNMDFNTTIKNLLSYEDENQSIKQLQLFLKNFFENILNSNIKHELYKKYHNTKNFDFSKITKEDVKNILKISKNKHILLNNNIGFYQNNYLLKENKYMEALELNFSLNDQNKNYLNFIKYNIENIKNNYGLDDNIFFERLVKNLKKYTLEEVKLAYMIDNKIIKIKDIIDNIIRKSDYSTLDKNLFNKLIKKSNEFLKVEEDIKTTQDKMNTKKNELKNNPNNKESIDKDIEGLSSELKNFQELKSKMEKCDINTNMKFTWKSENLVDQIKNYNECLNIAFNLYNQKIAQEYNNVNLTFYNTSKKLQEIMQAKDILCSIDKFDKDTYQTVLEFLAKFNNFTDVNEFITNANKEISTDESKRNFTILHNKFSNIKNNTLNFSKYTLNELEEKFNIPKEDMDELRLSNYLLNSNNNLLLYNIKKYLTKYLTVYSIDEIQDIIEIIEKGTNQDEYKNNELYLRNSELFTAIKPLKKEFKDAIYNFNIIKYDINQSIPDNFNPENIKKLLSNILFRNTVKLNNDFNIVNILFKITKEQRKELINNYSKFISIEENYTKIYEDETHEYYMSNIKEFMKELNEFKSDSLLKNKSLDLLSKFFNANGFSVKSDIKENGFVGGQLVKLFVNGNKETQDKILNLFNNENSDILQTLEKEEGSFLNPNMPVALDNCNYVICMLYAQSLIKKEDNSLNTFYKKDFVLALKDLQKNPEDLKNIQEIFKLIDENKELLTNEITSLDTKMYDSNQSLKFMVNLIDNKQTEKYNKILKYVIIFCLLLGGTFKLVTGSNLSNSTASSVPVAAA